MQICIQYVYAYLKITLNNFMLLDVLSSSAVTHQFLLAVRTIMYLWGVNQAIDKLVLVDGAGCLYLRMSLHITNQSISL